MENHGDVLKAYINLDLGQEDLDNLEQYFVGLKEIPSEKFSANLDKIVKFLNDHIQGEVHVDVDGLSLEKLFNLGGYLKINQQQDSSITPAMNSLRAELMLALEKDTVPEEQIPALRKYAATLARVSGHILKKREYSEEQKSYIKSEWWFILLSLLLIAIPMSSTPATFMSIIGLSGTAIASAEFMTGGLICGILFGFYQIRKEQNRVRRDIALGNVKYHLKKEANDRQLKQLLQELIEHLHDVAGSAIITEEEIKEIQDIACEKSLSEALAKLEEKLNNTDLIAIVSEVNGTMQAYKREAKIAASISWLKFWTYPWMSLQDWIKMVFLGAISLYCVFYKYDSILASTGIITFLAGTALVPALPYIFAAINIALTLALISTLIYSGYKKYRQTELKNNLDNQIRSEDKIHVKNEQFKEKLRYIKLDYLSKKTQLEFNKQQQASITDHHIPFATNLLANPSRRKKIKRSIRVKKKLIRKSGSKPRVQRFSQVFAKKKTGFNRNSFFQASKENMSNLSNGVFKKTER